MMSVVIPFSDDSTISSYTFIDKFWFVNTSDNSEAMPTPTRHGITNENYDCTITASTSSSVTVGCFIPSSNSLFIMGAKFQIQATDNVGNSSTTQFEYWIDRQ